MTFELDGVTVAAAPGETIWEVAKREGTRSRISATSTAGLSHRRQLPRLHGRDRGRARAGRVLHPQAHRRHEGQDRHRRAQSRAQMVFELLASRSAGRARPRTIRTRPSGNGRSASACSVSRFPPSRRGPHADSSPSRDGGQSRRLHRLRCCCVRACREVQVNDVIGMADRGGHDEDRLRLRRPDGRSHLRRLRRMRAGLPDRRADAGSRCSTRTQTRVVRPTARCDSLCPFCGVGCQLTYHVKDNKIVHVDGRDGPANHNRLCVKGRFGFDYDHHPSA